LQKKDFTYREKHIQKERRHLMTYYRIAWRDRQTAMWIWMTTALASLQAVFQLLRSFRTLPQDSIRVFIAGSKEDLNAMLRRENTNLVSGSVTAAQFLRARLLRVPGESATEPAVQPAIAFVTGLPRREQNILTGSLACDDVNFLERQRLERECGPGGDHDTPYCFSLPISMPQLLAWICLQARVQAGELEP
jgi:hypothetical protein